MSQKRKINAAGLALIKRFEGFSPTIYVCSGGKKTIGYGHVITSKDEFAKKKKVKISFQEATELLQQDVEYAESAVNKIPVELNSNQFSALVSLVFNIGACALERSNGYKALLAEEHYKAEYEFFNEKDGFVKAGDFILPGLVKRRNAEFELWKAQ